MSRYDELDRIRRPLAEAAGSNDNRPVGPSILVGVKEIKSLCIDATTNISVPPNGIQLTDRDRFILSLLALIIGQIDRMQAELQAHSPNVCDKPHQEE